MYYRPLAEINIDLLVGSRYTRYMDWQTSVKRTMVSNHTTHTQPESTCIRDSKTNLNPCYKSTAAAAAAAARKLI